MDTVLSTYYLGRQYRVVVTRTSFIAVVFNQR